MTWARGTPPRTARRQASIFGIMPAGQASAAARAARRRRSRERRLVAVRPVGVEALDVGEDDELARAEGHGERGGGGVGVDVVARRRRRPGRPWRPPGCGRPRRGRARRRVDRRRRRRPARCRPARRRRSRCARAAVNRPRVLTGQADRVRAVGVDQPDELAADLADEHHADDVHRLGGGDAQAAAELASMPSRSSMR